MYSRQNRNHREEVSIELPRDYGGSVFYPFPTQQDSPLRSPTRNNREEEKTAAVCDKETKCKDEEDDCEKTESACEAPHPVPCPPKGTLRGLSGLFGGNIGLEELLLLGVIFLIFSDDDLRDNELLICLLLILFI